MSAKDGQDGPYWLTDWQQDFSPETFRQLFAALDVPTRERVAIGVTSAVAGEGRTTTAIGLAVTLALDLGTATLVEADFATPAFDVQLGVASGPGLADVLRGERDLKDVLQEVSIPGSDSNLLVATAGNAGSNPEGLLSAVAYREPLRGLPGITVVDLPPVLNYGYGAMAAKAADIVVLVVRSGVTPVDLVNEAVARLEAENRTPRGTVLNAATIRGRQWTARNAAEGKRQG